MSPDATTFPEECPAWEAGDVTRVPYVLYKDPAIFDREMDRLFCGQSWAYVGLSAELPRPRDYKTTKIGNRSVVITRDAEGRIRGFVNRCAHRGVKLCQSPRGSTRSFVCPYHKWTYDHTGKLLGVPFS